MLYTVEVDWEGRGAALCPLVALHPQNPAGTDAERGTSVINCTETLSAAACVCLPCFAAELSDVYTNSVTKRRSAHKPCLPAQDTKAFKLAKMLNTSRHKITMDNRL